jgi:hypothetical protein
MVHASPKPVLVAMCLLLMCGPAIATYEACKSSKMVVKNGAM